MAELRIDKPLTTDDIFKGVVDTFSDFETYDAEKLQWYMVTRNQIDGSWPAWSDEADDMRNLFKSFGLAREDDNDWFKAIHGVTDYYNATTMMIGVIDQDLVGSYIDGSTLRLNVPMGTGSTDYVTFYGSQFVGAPFNDSNENFIAATKEERSVYGAPICALYPNSAAGGTTPWNGPVPANSVPTDWSFPYKGTFRGEEHPNEPYVTGSGSFIASETKRTTPHLRATHHHHATGIGYDMPFGLAFLDRGIFIIFDYKNGSKFLENQDAIYTGTSASTIWEVDNGDLAAFSGGTTNKNSTADNRKKIHFAETGDFTAGVVHSQVNFRTITREYKMIYFCHAGTGEFNSTTNHTYNHAKGYFVPSEADSVWVTEVALYGPDSDPHASRREPIAYAKLSEPVEKNRLETLTFKVSLVL